MALHPRIMNLWNESKLHSVKKLMSQSIFLIVFIGGTILFFVWHYNDFIFSIIQKAIPQFDIESKDYGDYPGNTATQTLDNSVIGY